ncbi:MAG: hypothetical protein H6715_04725 [Myxococcales bacterium]|nr:hypothetical protein [Myxococcales bacterium]MCB9708411.1 hypothetical protein [Myxococcales bacterium]
MRIKIIAGNLAAIVIFGLASYWLVRSEFERRLLADIEGRMGQDQSQLERSWRLSGIEFTNAVREQADTSRLHSVFSALDETARRTRAYEAADAVASWFQDPARGMPSSPEIVVITDETGRVIARNADRNQMYGMQLDEEIQALRLALRHATPGADVWKRHRTGDLLRTAVAPVLMRGDKRVLGALVVSYDVSDGVASSEAKLIGRDVAFIAEDRAYSSSLPPRAFADLKSYLFEGGAKDKTAAIFQGKTRTATAWRTELGPSDYQGVITPPLAFTDSAPLAAVVLGNRSEAVEKASPANIILILMVFFALVVIGYGMAMGSLLLRPVEQIEEGVLAIINGDKDLRLDIASPEFGGLAYRINQLLNVFAGVPESTESHSGTSCPPEPGAWRDVAFTDTASRGSASVAETPTEAIDISDPAFAARLAAEDEDQYYSRVYKEYVRAKRATGEDVSQIPKDRFVQRLVANEAALVKQQGCRLVRFVVQRQGDQVHLQPVFIR